METTQKFTQTDQTPNLNEVFNNYLDGLTVGRYKEVTTTLKLKLGWTSQVLSQKRKGASRLSLSEQLAIETLTGDLIF